MLLFSKNLGKILQINAKKLINPINPSLLNDTVQYVCLFLSIMFSTVNKIFFFSGLFPCHVDLEYLLYEWNAFH